MTPEEQAEEERRLERNRAYQKKQRNKKKASQPEKPRKRSLGELAKLDKTGADLAPEEAAAELAKQRAHQSEAVKKSRLKMYEDAAAGNPEAQARYERFLATRRENYHRKKQAEAGTAQAS